MDLELRGLVEDAESRQEDLHDAAGHEQPDRHEMDATSHARHEPLPLARVRVEPTSGWREDTTLV
jgi:hypothetical protein